MHLCGASVRAETRTGGAALACVYKLAGYTPVRATLPVTCTVDESIVDKFHV